MTPTSSWRPTVADVAAVVPQRTGSNVDGSPIGTFDATTIPTAAQVEGLISQVQQEVRTRVGDVPDQLALPLETGGGPGTTSAGRVVAVGTAYYVELSFYPDQQLGGRSVADMLRDRYDKLMSDLAAAADELRSGSTLGDTTVLPRWGFPATVSAGLATTPWERY